MRKWPSWQDGREVVALGGAGQQCLGACLVALDAVTVDQQLRQSQHAIEFIGFDRADEPRCGHRGVSRDAVAGQV
jgi:hypothetical protein